MASTACFLGSKGLRFLLSLLWFKAAVIGATPRPAVGDKRTNNTPSLQREPLNKRVQGQFPNFPDDYNGRVRQGFYLNSLFPLDNSAADLQNSGITVSTPWQYDDDVERWGWTRHMRWAPFPTEDSKTDSDDDSHVDSHNDADVKSDEDKSDQFDTSPRFGNTMDDAFMDTQYHVDPAENGVSTYRHINNFIKGNGGVGTVSNSLSIHCQSEI